MLSNTLTESYVNNHLKVCETLFKLLKLYIESKNCGIHGFSIGLANQALNRLYLEIANLRSFRNYLIGEELSLPVVYKKELPIALNFKPSEPDVVRSVKDELLLVFNRYKDIKQSACIYQISRLLEVLN